MYTEVHLKYIKQGVDLCTKLSNVASSKDATGPIQQELATYTENSAKAVAELVKAVGYSKHPGCPVRVADGANRNKMRS